MLNKWDGKTSSNEHGAGPHDNDKEISCPICGCTNLDDMMECPAGHELTTELRCPVIGCCEKTYPVWLCKSCDNVFNREE